MDVHRIRFVPFPAHEINALAFSHPSKLNEPTPPQLRLALGRSNGDIEIWNPQSRPSAASASSNQTSKQSAATFNVSGSGATWSQETILRGGKDRTIEGLAWTQDLGGENLDGKKIAGKLRLFSIGYSTHVTEWDLATGQPLRHTAAGQSEVWCMAAQPRWETLEGKKKGNKSSEVALDPKQEQLLALGCGDGSIALLSTAEGELTYMKTLQRSSGKKPRVMSLAWYGRDKIVAGYSDSMIRVFEVNGRGKMITQMSLGTAGKGGPSETLVWTVKVLRDDTIVSGDSAGEIKIWDAKNFTLLQRLKGHLADVLSLAIGHDGKLLLSGGMDRRTTLYQRAAPETKGSKGRWSAVSHQRNHQSDVKAMATFESKQMSVVVSGGLDAAPIINPLRTFGQENHRTLPAFPSSPAVCSAPKSRLMLSWWDREVSVWHIPPRHQTEDDAEDSAQVSPSTHTLVARIAVQGEESITSADISPSGDLVAIASMSALKLFSLRPRNSATTYRISKVELPKAAASVGLKLIRFSPDGKWIAASSSTNSLRMYRLQRGEEDMKQPWQVLNTAVEFKRHHGQTSQRAIWGTHGEFDHVISRFAWSSDSRILVSGDLGGTLNTWVLEGTENLEWSAAGLSNGKPAKVDDDSSEDESDDDDQPEVILGQHWKAHSERMPVIPGAPVVLSFRPSTTVIQENANIGLHATRHNPAPHSHGISHGEDRLLVVTAKQDVLLFNALTGKLTDWSKRNPPSTFPLAFRNILDQPMGAVWDVKDQASRVWLYGNSWLYLFDLSRDLPAEPDVTTLPLATNDQISKKRKRDVTDSDKRALIKQNAGAGSKIHASKLNSGTGLGVRTHKGEQMLDGDVEAIAFEASRYTRAVDESESDASIDEEEADEEDDDTDDEDGKQLVAVRRANRNVDRRDHDREEDNETESGESPHYWHTFKYRPIIGIVALEGSSGIKDGDDEARKEGQTSGKALEVALVERPLWDAGLKPRWEGPQEYSVTR